MVETTAENNDVFCLLKIYHQSFVDASVPHLIQLSSQSVQNNHRVAH